MKTLITTLVLVQRDDKILLGMKKRGFGKGRWNGFGGKIHEGETIKEAAYRECVEEVGIICKNLNERGMMIFNFEDKTPTIEMHIYSTDDFDGEPNESEEMRPQWFHKDGIPFDLMWPDDEYWFPLFLQGKNFEGEFWFKDSNTLLKHELTEK